MLHLSYAAMSLCSYESPHLCKLGLEMGESKHNGKHTCFRSQLPPGLIPSITKMYSEEKIVEDAEVNQ